MGYLGDSKGTKGQTYYSGSKPKKAFSVRFGSGKKNKQSEGFLDMAVTYLTKKVKEIKD